MISYIRRQEIMNYLNEKHFATIKELAKVIYTSESSVRRDIKQLEQTGCVCQTYGGVVLSEYANNVIPICIRDSSNSEVKNRLAKKAAEYVSDGDTIFMDGSSTVRRIIKHLNNFENLKIITNNCRIFKENVNEKIKLYCTGGRFVSQSSIFTGAAAENYIRTVNADIFFFSSQAISPDGIISDVSESETSLRKVMLSRAKKKIFLCDSSKIGAVKTFTLCSKDDTDAIICDAPLPWE